MLNNEILRERNLFTAKKIIRKLMNQNKNFAVIYEEGHDYVYPAKKCGGIILNYDNFTSKECELTCFTSAQVVNNIMETILDCGWDPIAIIPDGGNKTFDPAYDWRKENQIYWF